MTNKDACIKQLEKHIEQLRKENKELKEIIQNLQNQLAKNSGNSSKPPSTDGYRKPRTTSLRKSNGKKNGGQKGHKSHTLKAVENPDYIQTHKVNQCEHCHASLDDKEIIGYEKHQYLIFPLSEWK